MSGKLVGINPAVIVVIAAGSSSYALRIAGISVLILNPVKALDAPVDQVVELAVCICPVQELRSLDLILGGIGDGDNLSGRAFQLLCWACNTEGRRSSCRPSS